MFQTLPTFVYELFETMQSSVTRSKTSITKSLPASFKLSIFTLSSDSYIKIHCFFSLKLKFPLLETRVSSAWNRWFRHMETNGSTHDLSAKSGRYSSTVTAKIAITVLSLVAVTALLLHYKRVMLCFVTVTAKHIFIFL